MDFSLFHFAFIGCTHFPLIKATFQIISLESNVVLCVSSHSPYEIRVIQRGFFRLDEIDSTQKKSHCYCFSFVCSCVDLTFLCACKHLDYFSFFFCLCECTIQPKQAELQLDKDCQSIEICLFFYVHRFRQHTQSKVSVVITAYCWYIICHINFFIGLNVSRIAILLSYRVRCWQTSQSRIQLRESTLRTWYQI